MTGVVVVMGVSGCGKTTVGELLARRLAWAFVEGDALHPAANVEKMRAGIALADEDRWPWLAAIASRIGGLRAGGTGVVVACSALKRSYRDVLRGSRDDVRFVYLRGDRETIAARLTARSHDYMPASLLASQFAALEEPDKEEAPIVVSVEDSPEAIVEAIVTSLSPRDSP
jgi:gluconokinase